MHRGAVTPERFLNTTGTKANDMLMSVFTFDTIVYTVAPFIISNRPLNEDFSFFRRSRTPWVGTGRSHGERECAEVLITNTCHNTVNSSESLSPLLHLRQKDNTN